MLTSNKSHLFYLILIPIFKMNYKEQLLDPRWQRRRLEILQRDNWTCQYCNNTKRTLMVHHLVYENEFAWEASDETLITLCDKCHEEYHTSYLKYEKIILFNVRKKLKDPFIIKCAADLFNDVHNLNDLIYYLWETRFQQKDVLNELRSIEV